jgi:hypothetical protein
MRGRVDYNIEFGHIMTYEKGLRFLQKKSIELAKETIERIEREGKTYTTCVLIDDYLSSYSYLDVGNYLIELGNLMPPNYVAYESRMVDAIKELFRSIPKRKEIIKKQASEVDSTKNVLFLVKGSDKISLKEESIVKFEERYHTPILIACWHLMRLGLIKPRGVKETRIVKKKPFAAKNIITIIPRIGPGTSKKKMMSYMNVEKQALKIISCTRFKKYTKNIGYVYF